MEWHSAWRNAPVRREVDRKMQLVEEVGLRGPYFAGPGGVRRLKMFVGGEWVRSRTDRYSPVYDASTGEVTSEAPRCLEEEVAQAVAAAKRAFDPWWQTPAEERIQVL